MGFAQVRRDLIAALRSGNYEHEARDVLAEKNLLASGEVTEDEVVVIINRAKGTDYGSSPHHWDSSVTVHTLKPVVNGERWYIKAYFVNPAGKATFISVHK